ncbi:hypothetical protein GPALN_009747 [Globodera pallida]|nr:hypothetical protein GPALN_009747 [Globodera pallida]
MDVFGKERPFASLVVDGVSTYWQYSSRKCWRVRPLGSQSRWVREQNDEKTPEGSRESVEIEQVGALGTMGLLIGALCLQEGEAQPLESANSITTEREKEVEEVGKVKNKDLEEEEEESERNVMGKERRMLICQIEEKAAMAGRLGVSDEKPRFVLVSKEGLNLKVELKLGDIVMVSDEVRDELEERADV